MGEELQIRIHGDASGPTLVYLPGLHGDWTLVGSFREALQGRARFVEFIYPRTLTWSLEEYAEAIERALAANEITRGWLLGESFGSQIVWPLLHRERFHVIGIVLAGGFARHPIGWGVRFAEKLGGSVPLRLITWILFSYAKLARFRFRRSPQTMAGVQEFIARRTELDRRAAVHRLHLIAENDPCSIAQNARVPIFGMTGIFDPIVQWWWVRPWLRRNCVSLRDYKIFWGADHNVLGTAPKKTAEQVVAWISRGSPDASTKTNA
jgi:pimeloyl-ACP methyl ester carboxylesterase